jgi:hypothetical protein
MSETGILLDARRFTVMPRSARHRRLWSDGMTGVWPWPMSLRRLNPEPSARVGAR